jgi:heptosyltransferase-2
LDAAGDSAIDTTGQLSLLASAELIGRAALLVTNDSSPLHLASAMNTPTLAVFGPTVPEFGFGPLAEVAATEGISSLPCRPCDKHGPQRCPLGHWKCMRELSPEAVAAVAQRLLGGRG